MRKLIIVFAVFNFLLGIAFAEEEKFKENNARKFVDIGINYCKEAEKSWSDYKIDQHCRKALKFFHKAIRIGWLTKEELITVYVNQGSCYGYMRYYDKAEENLNKALKLDPQNTLVLLNRAINYANMGKKDNAIEDLEKVIELDAQGTLAKKAEEILDCL